MKVARVKSTEVNLKVHRTGFFLLLTVILGVGFAAVVPAQAQTYTVLGILPSNVGPITNIAAEHLVQGRNGDIYAISTAQGGLASATTSGTFAEVAQPGG